MIGVGFRNLDKFTQHIDSWVEGVRDETAQAANGLAVEVFETLLENSPQYSGDFVGNWQYSINQVNTTFTPLHLLDQDPSRTPFGTGSRPAITYAKAMNKGRDWGFKLGDTFYLSNSAAHDEKYALKIEEGTINFRFQVGNQGRVVARTLAEVAPKYTYLSGAQVNKLRRKKL